MSAQERPPGREPWIIGGHDATLESHIARISSHESSAVADPGRPTWRAARDSGLAVVDHGELGDELIDDFVASAVEELTLALGVLVPELDDHRRGEHLGLDHEQLRGAARLSLLSLGHRLSSLRRRSRNARDGSCRPDRLADR